MLRKPGLGLILAVYALFNLAFDGANATTGVFVARKFLTQPWQLGLLFVASGIAIALVQAVFTQRLVGRFGEKSVALMGLIGNAVTGLLIFSAPLLWLLYPVVFLSGGLTGFIWAPMGALAANSVSEREQGQLAGVNAALSGLMAAIGPLWGGLAYDHLMPGSPYLISAVIVGIACLLLIQVKAAAPVSHQISVRSPAD